MVRHHLSNIRKILAKNQTVDLGQTEHITKYTKQWFNIQVDSSLAHCFRQIILDLIEVFDFLAEF